MVLHFLCFTLVFSNPQVCEMLIIQIYTQGQCVYHEKNVFLGPSQVPENVFLVNQVAAQKDVS